jgi:Salmonella virulence plasmid 65kDa B protein
MTSPAGQRASEDAAPAGLRVPAISQPKGCSGMRGIGEEVSVDAAAGASGPTIPLELSAGQTRLGPDLTLSYRTGAGNGPFGFGTLSFPAVTRKADRGIPKYREAEETDVFILSGAEEPVPVLEPDGTRHFDTTPSGFATARDRPRVEDVYARIERPMRPESTTDLGTCHYHSDMGEICELYLIAGCHADAWPRRGRWPERYDCNGRAGAYGATARSR